MPSPYPTPPAQPRHRFFTRTRRHKDNTEHVGRTNDIQTFFEAPDFDEKDPKWVEYAPPSLPLAKKNKHEGAAFQIYKRRNTAGKREGYFVQKIRLQSPYLRDALKETLEPFGITYKDNLYADSTAPHRGLFFTLDRIAELSKTADDEVTRSHCELLCTLVEEIFDDALDQLETLERDNKITFDLLWTMFPEGSVFGKKNDTSPPQGLKVVRVDQNEERMRMVASGVVFDGFRYGTMEWTWRIYNFDGILDRSDIPSIKYIDLDKNLEVRNRLLERGRKALDLQSIGYMTYKPENSDPDKSNGFKLNQEQDESERVIIDPHLYRMRCVSWEVDPLPGYKKFKSNISDGEPDEQNDQIEQIDMHEEVEDYRSTRKDKTLRRYNSREGFRAARMSKYDDRGGGKYYGKQESLGREALRRPTKAELEINRKAVLESDDNLLTMYPQVCGYSLDRRAWVQCQIDQLYPIETDKGVFEKVVLDDTKKDIVKTLVEGHRDLMGRYDDLIVGKGQCLLVILSGPPGTGKTLMAESLAEHLGCPLLRADSHFIQQNRFQLIQGYSATLGQFLRDATEWGGLVLFDEPDFLFQNQETGADRKDLLAFLRQAEYFRGIIFLTTNLTRTIDPAVISRAQIYLTFPALTSPMRVRVWENFVERLPEGAGTLSPEAIARLATWQVNGREIKNILNMTVSFCRKKKQKLTLEAIESLLKTICPSARREGQDLPTTNGVNGSAEKDLSRDMFLLDL